MLKCLMWNKSDINFTFDINFKQKPHDSTKCLFKVLRLGFEIIINTAITFT